MPVPLQIDYVSDIACPWCAVGLASLEEALRRVEPDIVATLHFQPFELNPDMQAGGENLHTLLGSRYGSSPQQLQAMQAGLRARAAEVGLVINQDANSRVYNTFAAHRLLHWSHLHGKQLPTQRELFKANFTSGADVSSTEVLVDVAREVGLDAEMAREVLDGGLYAREVRQAEQLWTSRGIHAVPAIVINQQWLISGGQPPEAFAQALQEAATQVAAAAAT